MDFTKISRQMLERAKQTEHMDYDGLYDTFVKNEFPIYDIGEVIKKYLARSKVPMEGEAKVYEKEVTKFAKEHDISPAFLKRLIENQEKLTRRQAIEFCFHFDLELEEANAFLLEVRQNALHFRSYDELIYAFYLMKWNRGTLKEAQALIEEYTQIYARRPSRGEKQTVNYGKQATEEKIESSYTAYVKTLLHTSTFDIEALKEFLNQEGKSIMSDLNATAVEKLKKYMSEIQQEMEWVMGIEDTLKDIVESLELSWIYDGRETSASMTRIDKAILNGTNGDLIKKWNPNLIKYFKNESMATEPTVLSNIRNYGTEVSRKTFLLVLLYHLSWFEYAAWADQWERQETLQKRFPQLKEYVFERAVDYVNQELDSCGFPPLHPRVPFDFAVLCALANIQDPHEAFTQAFQEKKEVVLAAKEELDKDEERIIFVHPNTPENAINLDYSDESGRYLIETDRSPKEWEKYVNGYVKIKGVWERERNYLKIKEIQKVSV